jgi:hypothetical protein
MERIHCSLVPLPLHFIMQPLLHCIHLMSRQCRLAQLTPGCSSSSCPWACCAMLTNVICCSVASVSWVHPVTIIRDGCFDCRCLGLTHSSPALHKCLAARAASATAARQHAHASKISATTHGATVSRYQQPRGASSNSKDSNCCSLGMCQHHVSLLSSLSSL